MSSVEKETAEKEAAKQGFEDKVEELARKKIESIKRDIAAGKTVLINGVSIRSIELVKGKRSYYVLINEGQKDEMVIYISEFVRRPVKAL
ncbi:MAG: hypothetical protein RXR01_06800 [Thermoproteus sp.]